MPASKRRGLTPSRTLQFFHLRLQLRAQLLQAFNLPLLPLNNYHRLRQLLLQFRNPLIL